MPSENQPSLKCPNCGSATIRRSHRNPLDRLRSLAGYKPYRCHDCQRRFHFRAEPAGRKAQSSTRSESRKRRQALKRREAVIYALALAAFAIVAFVITLERG